MTHQVNQKKKTKKKYNQKTRYTYKELFNLQAPSPQNDQTHSNNSSGNCRQDKSMKGSWYEQDGLLHERSSENVTSSASCSQRKLTDWQTKNKSSGDEGSNSGGQEENLPVFD